MTFVVFCGKSYIFTARSISEKPYLYANNPSFSCAYMRPMLKYRGGKSKEIVFLQPHIPVYHGRYIEPFFGGGAMYFHLEPHAAVINDINEPLMAFYRGVRDNYAVLRAELDGLEMEYNANRQAFERLKAQHPDDRVEDRNDELYYRIRDMFNGRIAPEYLDATIYYFINKTAYSGMIRYNAQGEYNVPYGRYKNFNTHIITPEHSALLQNADIRSGTYEDVFNDATPDDFIFLDPPYDCIFSDYGNEEYRDGFGEASHRQLAEDFYNLPCPALLVIGLTPLTQELYGNSIVGQYDKAYSVNIRNRFHSAATHIIVANH